MLIRNERLLVEKGWGTPFVRSPARKLRAGRCCCDGGGMPAPSRRDLLLTGVGIGGATTMADFPSLALDSRQTGVDSLRKTLEDAISEFTLPNGLHFIIMERHVGPVVSCHSFVDAGAFDEQDGKTGVAHLLEHMMFKGTKTLGVADYRMEESLLNSLDEVFYEQQAALREGRTAQARKLTKIFEQLQVEAAKPVVPNAFGALMEEEGAVGVNAATGHDSTTYFMALPSNKLELWFAAESDRLMNPVFRELYSEKRVVSEERQLRVDSSPLGKFQEDFRAAALSNNYRRPVIGYQRDIDGLGRKEATEFFEQHYNPLNVTMSIVGDVNPEETYRLAERYFGDWQAPVGWEKASGAKTDEPLAIPEAVASGDLTEYKRVGRTGPVSLLAFYRPSLLGPEGVVLDAVSELLAGGRTSRLTRELVQTGKAVSASLVVEYPGNKHPGLVVAFGIPGEGLSVEDISNELQQKLTGLANSDITPQELTKLRKSLRYDLFQLLRSNSSLAAVLTQYHAFQGNWRVMLDELDARESMTANQIQDVCSQIFVESNCFKGFVLKA
ncbi:hypothetical protein BSKO_06943 [Bryopsis sp. KO-2023]|nr:hypothetical protein BSKO_06943 [Bryopsis sp. KO-2023]